MLENLIALTSDIEALFEFDRGHARQNKENHSKVYKEFGLTYLGHGISRVAFRYEDYVLKFGEPHNNEAEWKVWTSFKASQAAKVLTPCLHISKSRRTVIQAFAGETFGGQIKLGKCGYAEYDKAHDHIVKILDSAKVRYSDLHAGNISVSGLVVDYGHFRH